METSQVIVRGLLIQFLDTSAPSGCSVPVANCIAFFPSVLWELILFSLQFLTILKYPRKGHEKWIHEKVSSNYRSSSVIRDPWLESILRFEDPWSVRSITIGSGSVIRFLFLRILITPASTYKKILSLKCMYLW